MPTSRIAALLVVLAFAACGEDAEREAAAPSPEPPRTYEARGVTVTLPPGWHHATESLTPVLTEPREVLSVATFPMRHHETACAHVPGSALLDVGPGDAFVTLLERGYDRKGQWLDLPQRPERFGPALGGPSDASACVPHARFGDHWFGFSEGERRFHLMVAFGPEATEATRAEAWELLDGLRIDPAVRPDWQATP